MKSWRGRFMFKGGRKYVHGTDIYTSVVDCLGSGGNITDFDLYLHQFTSRQCDIFVGGDGAVPDAGSVAVATFSAIVGGEECRGFLLESNEVVKDRYEYNESELDRFFSLRGQAISVCGDPRVAPIDVLVSMTKKMHASLFPVANGGWFFSRLTLQRRLQPDDVSSFGVELVRNLNNNFTKSKVYASCQQIGHVYFSRVQR